MAIRRISDLPSMETVGNGELSDCVMEVSYKDETNNYRSCYTDVSKFGEYATKYVSNTAIERMTIDGGCLSVKNSDFTVDSPNKDVEIISKNITVNGSNGINIGSNSTKEVNIDSNQGINIGRSGGPKVNVKGNPVVINDNLSVYTTETKTDRKVNFTNTANNINAVTVATNTYSQNQNNNKVVTCELLYKVIGYPGSVINKITVGSGVEL